MSRLIFNKFLGTDSEGIKQGRLKFYNWTQPWKLGGKIAPSWQDIILSGNTALTLTNAKANGLNYLKLFGGTEQTGTPTPNNPIDIVCNNGAIKLSKNLFNKDDIYGNYLLTDTGLVGNAAISFFLTNFIRVYPNTTYTFSFISSADSQYRRICGYSSADQNTFTQLLVKKARPTTVGEQYNLTFTTDENTYYIRVSTIEDDTNIQLERGSTATSYRPYGSIYTDGTVETVEVTGKNLFNKNDAQVGKNWNGNSMAYSIASDYIPAKKGDVFILSVSDMPKHTSTTWVVLDSDYTYIGTVSNGSAITQDACAYIKLSIRCASTDSWTQSDLDNANIQLELGSTATEYEPYYYGGQATAEMLLKVGTYQDEQSVLDGKVTRNVGVAVLDGTERFSELGTPHCFRFSFSYRGMAGVNPICSHYPEATITLSVAKMPDQTIKGHATAADSFYLKDSRFSTAKELQAWLAEQYNAGTPVTIVYALETPTTESVESQALTIQAGTNIVEITQASIDNLELEVSYKAGVEVTVTEIENAQLDNSVEVTVNG